MTEPDAAWELRRALELICRKTNPPHRPVSRPVELASLGLPDADLSGVSLTGSYLRGLSPGAARLGDGSLVATVLDDADLAEIGLGDHRPRRVRLLGTRLPDELDPKWDGLRESGAREASLAPVLQPWTRPSIHALAVLPDGRVLAGGADGTVRLWDLEARKSLAVLERHTGPVLSIAVLDQNRAQKTAPCGSGASCPTRASPSSKDTPAWSGPSSSSTRTEPSARDRSGIRITSSTRPWVALRQGDRLLPNDPLLHRWSGYVADGRFAVPAFRFPELIDWEDFVNDDPDAPRTFVQKWPPEWTDDDVQDFLGRGRWIEDDR